MPLDALGRTRATMGGRRGSLRLTVVGNPGKPPTSGTKAWYTPCQQGISSRHGSPPRADYVPALCTHRPSLLPIELAGEKGGGRGNPPGATQGALPNPFEPLGLEEGEVVTRYP